MTVSEEQRARKLLEAQTKAEALFHEVETSGLIRPGITENSLNAKIYALANDLYGIKTYWHKRIVRSGKNTLLPYDDNPPDLTIGEDDILFLDLGPVFEQWEADFGRTFVLGSDPLKLKMRQDIKSAFEDGKQYFKDHPDITSRELFHYVESLAARYGWEFGGPIAGHLIGQFPHERIADDKVTLYVHPKSNLPMRSPDEDGRRRHWILEIHFVDREQEIGGFYEELLTI
ncbi:M24 family metallopeptidase [Granulicella sp. L60]|jgi:Xaa-Pro dipeptidase|uniref:M24 family metallopeptidase n=1 Tax=Granulicella sp. L60 TaxID=1641866 RepID=UPI00131E5955|nr:M24 family metallopeptidase [Granulicella sp. L60]